MKNAMKTGTVAIVSILVWASMPIASSLAGTYQIIDLGTLGTQGSFATGVNESNQVSGYSIDAENVSRVQISIHPSPGYRRETSPTSCIPRSSFRCCSGITWECLA